MCQLGPNYQDWARAVRGCSHELITADHNLSSWLGAMARGGASEAVLDQIESVSSQVRAAAAALQVLAAQLEGEEETRTQFRLTTFNASADDGSHHSHAPVVEHSHSHSHGGMVHSHSHGSLDGPAGGGNGSV